MSVELNTETFEKIKNALCELFAVKLETVTPDSSLIDDVGLDSLDGVELIIHLEEEFGIKIDEDESGSIKTVRDACLLVDKKVALNGTQSV